MEMHLNQRFLNERSTPNFGEEEIASTFLPLVFCSILHMCKIPNYFSEGGEYLLIFSPKSSTDYKSLRMQNCILQQRIAIKFETAAVQLIKLSIDGALKKETKEFYGKYDTPNY